MTVSWLHVSDFHFRRGDSYDRDVVLRALIDSIRRFREEGRRPDMVFATGDVAFSGQEEEYKIAETFFDALLEAAGIEKRHLLVIPGNHDVDRERGAGLTRTLESREEADRYFKPGSPKLHITLKQHAFIRWFNSYFNRIRTFPEDSTCGPIECIEIRGVNIGILPLNSALFCQGDDDHGKLFIGRRSLEEGLKKLDSFGASFNLALIHHPLSWLSDIEATNIMSALHAKVRFILRGHLHRTDIESVASISGETLLLAAGAAYQTRARPNRASYGTLHGDQLTIFPIRYEDEPKEVWTLDTSLFPHDPNYERAFRIPYGTDLIATRPSAPLNHQPEPQVSPKYASTRPPSLAGHAQGTLKDQALHREAGSVTKAAPGNADRKHVVVLVHGIRDFALWQTKVAAPLEENGFKVAMTNYGRFNLVEFLVPIPFFRNSAIATILNQLRIIKQNNESAYLSVVAHSFGTFVVAQIMKREFDIKFHRVIFCGSVMRYNFPFEDFQNRFDAPIVNEVGTRDVWPAIAESVTLGYGSAGTYGFRRPLIYDRWHNGAAHGYFLSDKFCERFWLPLLSDDTIVSGARSPESTRVWLRLLTIFKVKYLLVAGLLVWGLLSLGDLVCSGIVGEMLCRKPSCTLERYIKEGC
jgi:predicted phosphodiesterase